MPRLPRLRHKGPVMQARLANNSNNNLYCALDTKSVKTLKGNNCEKKREHSHSEIAKANRTEWLGHAEK